MRVRVGARWKKSGSGKKLFLDPLFLPLSLPDLFQHNSSAQAARVYHHINGPASVRSGYYLKCVGSCRQIFKYRYKRQIFRNSTVIYAILTDIIIRLAVPVKEPPCTLELK